MSTTIVVAEDLPERAEALRRLLERRGHDVVVRALDDVVAELGSGILDAELVVGADTLLGPRGADLAMHAQAGPAVTVIAAHDRVEPAKLWRTFAHGAVPWVPTHRGPLPAGAPVGVGQAAATALEALRLDLSDRTDLAYQALALVQDAAAMAAARDALVDAGARALGRFRSRARYAVSVDVLTSHLVRRLGPLDGQHFGSWWASTEDIALRSAGLHLERCDPRDAEELLGAFHAAGTMVRFTSRRQWRRADELLDELLSAPSMTALV